MAVFSMAGSNPALPTYPLQRSVRLRSSASAYFNRTFTTPTNQAKWTWSGWVKRGLLGTQVRLLSSGTSASDTTTTTVYFTTSDTLAFSGGTTNFRISNQVFRDPSAWYHIVIAVDTTLTEASKILIYVNGVQITFATTNAITTCAFNSAQTAYIGQFSSAGYFDGYLEEVNFVDGQQLTASSFGAYNSYGVWSPAKYTGSYGTNGFYLNFQDNSSVTTTANVGIGADSSGNGNYWTSNNISLTAGVTYDSMLDVPTNTSPTNANYAVLNPLCGYLTLSNANLTGVSTDTSNERTSISTILVSSGKWYAETTIGLSGGFNSQSNIAIGTVIPSSASSRPSSTTGGVGYRVDGQKEVAGTVSAYGSSYTNNDVIGIALDCDSNTVTFYKNNTSQGSIAITSGLLYFMCASLRVSSGTATSNWNFGQQPFTYTPPTGFNRLNTYNLPDSIVPVGAQYMAATLYTGNGSTQAITNTVNGTSMQPDFVWIKGRSGATNNGLQDSVRGTAGGILVSNSTAAESAGGAYISSLNSNGFTVNANASGNGSAATYVGWQWRASNASAVTNTAGTISSQVSANQTAGFSIVTYTGTGANATVGHGLGVAPRMMIIKRRNSTSNWPVYHASISGSPDNFLYLNSTSAVINAGVVFNGVTPNSTTFGVGTDAIVNASGGTYVGYMFAAVPGYSAFGSYTGNGSADGPFIYTGFRPRFVLYKSATEVTGWAILDTSRSPSNVADKYLNADTSAAEATASLIDIISNGFKVRNTFAGNNTNGATYIYAAFAENPFKNALAR